MFTRQEKPSMTASAQRIWLPAALMCAVGIALLGGCGRGKTSPEAQEALPDDIPALIEALASPNHFPRVLGPDVIYPPGFDHKAQERVRKAEARLRQKGFEAVPYLMEHLEDARYSYSEFFGEWHNHALGEVCFYIIEDLIDFYGFDYETREAADGKVMEKPSYLWSIARDGRMQEWWKERKGRSLGELQLEALQWTIEQERAHGFKDKAQEEQVMGPLLARLEELRSQVSH
jgi:hypothetical protein